MRNLVRRGLIGGIALALGAATASAAPARIPGVNALPGVQTKVAGVLEADVDKKGGETLDFVLTRIGETAPFTKYNVELTKQAHVIAVSDDFTTFIHRHVTRVAKDGHFRLTIVFPRPGLYHIYADSAPAGLGQQVLRFDLPVGGAGAERRPPALEPTGLDSGDGAYAVKFDSLDLSAGEATRLVLHIEKNGRPATDLKPFLGVAAHVVFIAADDLAYIHVHPMPILGMSGMPAMSGGDHSGHGHGEMARMAMMAPSASVAPDLALHVEPPKVGAYKFWVQFIGGGAVRTVQFVVVVR